MATVLSPALETFDPPVRGPPRGWAAGGCRDGRWAGCWWRGSPCGHGTTCAIPSIWIDEAALVVNVLGKEIREFLGPLLFSEAAHHCFFWIERGMAVVFGDGLYALRLVPFAASCAGAGASCGSWHGACFAKRPCPGPCYCSPFPTGCCGTAARPNRMPSTCWPPWGCFTCCASPCEGATLVRQMLVYAGLAPLLDLLVLPKQLCSLAACWSPCCPRSGRAGDPAHG